MKSSSSSTSPPQSWITFAILGMAAMGIIAAPKYLPMIDLPQHAAQISIWKHLNDPAFGFGQQFELHWSSPYLTGYVLGRLFSEVYEVRVALKLVIAMAVLALPLSLDRLFAASKSDRRLAIVGFPLAFGFAFHWGFLNFLVALPAGLFLLAYAHDYAAAPSSRKAILLALAALGVYLCHVMVFVVVMAAAVFVILRCTDSIQAGLIRILPLFLPLGPAMYWLAQTWSHEELARMPADWRLGWHRIVELPATLLGFRYDSMAGFFGCVLICSLFAARPRARKHLLAWVPSAMGVAAFLFFPFFVGGTFHIYPRFAVLIIPLTIIATEPSLPLRKGRVGRLSLVALTAAWLLVLGIRFHTFDSDARRFDRLVEIMQPNKRVLALTYMPSTPSLPGGPFLHFPAWYQVEKGGILGFSFAQVFPQLARYKPHTSPSMSTGLEWNPELFNWSKDGDYDYFVIRAADDVGRNLFANSSPSVVPVMHDGYWWLYYRQPQ